jgi:hypothetical protein
MDKYQLSQVQSYLNSCIQKETQKLSRINPMNSCKSDWHNQSELIRSLVLALAELNKVKDIS